MDSREVDDVLGQWYLEQTGQNEPDRPSLDGHDNDDAEDDPDFEDVPDDEEEGDDAAEYYDAEEGDYNILPLQVLIGEHFGHQHGAESEDEHDLADFDGNEEDQVDDDEDEYDDDDDDDDNETAAVVNNILAGAGDGWLSRAQLLALLRSNNLGDVIFEDSRGVAWGRRRRSPPDPDRFPKVPSEKGTELMHSGLFGANNFRLEKRKQLARRMLDRELGVYSGVDRQRNQDLMAQDMIPSSHPEMIIHYEDPVYSGQFSDDGNFFYSCGHDFQVRMYDTSNPYEWKYYKTVHYPFGQWTLTDASLSPDNKWLAYTSIQSNVCLAPTDPNDTGDPYTLNLSDRAARGQTLGWRSWDNFGIWSVRFSGDGRELVAGTNTHRIIVYDIESRTVLHSVNGHSDDVNAVCFADKSSPHILYSGSDDTTIKVWDRRSMADGREAGAFIGHVEGLTYIDSKGDGRYILSNSKDQTMKLWDLRMVMSPDRYRELNPTQYTEDRDFDYRWGTYRDEDWSPHPCGDNSVVTFRGHKVLRTLIRCHFSPPSSTNSRYVYTGSQDGKVWVYNLDATVAGVIDVKKATKNSRRPVRRGHPMYVDDDDHPGWRACVRDASWHPNAPLLVASAWNGLNATSGTCTLHAYNEAGEDEAEPRMGRSVDEHLKPNPDLFRDVVR